MNKQELKDLVAQITTVLRYDIKLRKEFRELINSDEEFTEPTQPDYPKMYMRDSWY